MLITRQPSISVTPNKTVGPHFKSTGCEPHLTLHQTLLYGVELLILIYTPIKSDVSVVPDSSFLVCFTRTRLTQHL